MIIRRNSRKKAIVLRAYAKSQLQLACYDNGNVAFFYRRMSSFRGPLLLDQNQIEMNVPQPTYNVFIKGLDFSLLRRV